MDIHERLEWLEREIEKTKELVKETEQEEKKFPQDGDDFYFIDENGHVIFATFDADYIENERIKNIGNCFKTLEEADFEVERRKVIKELKEYESDFRYDEYNYFLEYYLDTNAISKECDCICKKSVIYFASVEKAEEAIKAVGKDRIKK